MALNVSFREYLQNRNSQKIVTRKYDVHELAIRQTIKSIQFNIEKEYCKICKYMPIYNNIRAQYY